MCFDTAYILFQSFLWLNTVVVLHSQIIILVKKYFEIDWVNDLLNNIIMIDWINGYNLLKCSWRILYRHYLNYKSIWLELFADKKEFTGDMLLEERVSNNCC